MAHTELSNLIDPEVFAGFVEQKYVNKGVFSALATVDSTLEGQAGSTLSYPSYSYIGDSTEIHEGDQIAVDNISETQVDVKVKQIAKGTGIYDWALVNGLGNAMDEASSQIATSLADYRDNDLKSAIDNGNVIRLLLGDSDTFNSDTIIDALAFWGEDLDDKPFAYICNAKGLATLRKDANYINGSEIQTDAMIRGTVGSIWGANIILSNKCTDEAYLIKQGALRIVSKKGVNAETKREADYKRTGIFADVMYAPYVYKGQDIIKVFKTSDVDTSLTFEVKAGETGKTVVDFSNFAKMCPVNCKIVYKDGNASAPTFARGTALTGYSPLPADGIVTATASKYLAIAIVDGADKPIAGASHLMATGEIGA